MQTIIGQLILFIVLIFCHSIQASEAQELKIQENFFAAIEQFESKPYEYLLEQLPQSDRRLEIDFRLKLKSEWVKVTSSPQNDFSILIRDYLKLDFYLNSFNEKPPKVEVIEENRFGDFISQRLKITDATLGIIEARMMLPHNPKGRRPAILGIHGHGGNCKDFVQKEISQQLVDAGNIILTVNFKAMRRLYESKISKELVRRGHHLMAIRLYETFIALQILKSHPLVDSELLGILAHSGGSLIANLFIRIFPGISALVYDYESSMETDWTNLCCESLPNLRPFNDYLQNIIHSPIPSIKTDYGFRVAPESIVAFFSEHLPTVKQSVSKKSPMRDEANQQKTRSKFCDSPFSLIRDECLLSFHVDNLTNNRIDKTNAIFDDLRRPDSKIKYLLDILPNSSQKIELFQKIREVIKAIHDGKMQSEMLKLVTNFSCEFGVASCSSWIHFMNEDKNLLNSKVLMKSFKFAVMNTGSVNGFQLTTHLSDERLRLITLMNMVHSVAKPEIRKILINQIRHLTKDRIPTHISECIFDSIDASEFTSGCDNYSAYKEFLRPAQVMPEAILHKMSLGNSDYLNFLDLIQADVDEIPNIIFRETSSVELSAEAKLSLLSSMDKLFRRIYTTDAADLFGLNLIAHLRTFNRVQRSKWINRILKRVEIVALHERSDLLRQVLEEVIQFFNHNELKSILERHRSYLKVEVLAELFEQTVQLEKADSAEIILSYLLELSPQYRKTKLVTSFLDDLKQSKDLLQVKLLSILDKIKNNSISDEDIDWLVDMPSNQMSIIRLMSSELIKSIFDKFGKKGFEDPSLNGWWFLFYLTKDFNKGEIDDWIQDALLKSLKLTQTAEEDKITLVYGLIEHGQLNFAELVLQSILDTSSEVETRILKEWFFRNNSDDDLLRTFERIRNLSHHSRFVITRLILKTITREDFKIYFKPLLHLVKFHGNQEENPLILEWINCAVKQDFTVDAFREARQLELEIGAANDEKSLNFYKQMYVHFMDMGLQNKAKKLVYNLLSRKCNSSDCYREKANFLFNAMEDSKVLHKLSLTINFFKGLNTWLSKHDNYRDEFCEDFGFEDLCTPDGYFKLSELASLDSR